MTNDELIATMKKNEEQRARDLAREYERLVDEGREEEADALFDAPAPLVL